MTRTDRRRFLVLFAAIAALLALFGALALPATAQAQTATTFVSNLGQTDFSGDSLTSPSSPRAQQFKTGSNPGGYTLTEIVVNIRDARTGIPAFALYTSMGDEPGTKVVDLSGDSSTAGEQSFTPASATTLNASTKYIIVFYMTSGQANLQRTSSDNIDSGASPGWDITDFSLYTVISPDWGASANSLEIAIKGTAGTIDEPPAAPANTGKPAITSYDLRYRVGDSASWTDGPQDETGTTAAISGLTADTEYQVQVRATNAEATGHGRRAVRAARACPRSTSASIRARTRWTRGAASRSRWS